MTFYSQSKQDEWVNILLNGKTDGYFLDIGAYDGVATSNSYFFESEKGWTGVCVEADPGPFVNLSRVRTSKNYNVAAMDYDGVCNFSNMVVGSGPEIPCRKINGILEESGAPDFIDYLSIDIEGLEYTVLSDIDFDRWTFGLMTVEHNLYCDGPENKNKIYDLLTSRGYVRVQEDVVSLDNSNPIWYLQPYEDWYVHESIIGELNL